MNLKVFLLFISLPICVLCLPLDGEVVEKNYNYKGYRLLRLVPDSVSQLQYLNDISSDLSYFIPEKKIDFWTHPKDLNSSVDLMVSPDVYKDIRQKLSLQNIKNKVVIKDVGDLLEEETKDNENRLLYRTQNWSQNSSAFFDAYHSLSEIYQYLDDLQSINKDMVSVEAIGTSSESRSLKMIKIGVKSKDGSQKPIFWIDAGIHAREWVAPSTALFIANKLITSTDSDVKNLLNVFDFYIIPSANPDGYEYSRQKDRMWRKTRSNNEGFWGLFCKGVDPNRNYGFKWGETGSSPIVCSETYHGPRPFSEPETKAISDYIIKMKDHVKVYIAMHSYSQFILTPWGWTKELPRQYNDMLTLGQKAAQALKSRFNTQYKVGSSTHILYEAAGGADDWAHGSAGIKYSYTFELRDTGNYGFLLPARFIVPTGEETFDAIKTMANELKDEYKLKPINT